jgi:hypothetical protein
MGDQALLKRLDELLKLLDQNPNHAKLRRLAEDMRALRNRLRASP